MLSLLWRPCPTAQSALHFPIIAFRHKTARGKYANRFGTSHLFGNKVKQFWCESTLKLVCISSVTAVCFFFSNSLLFSFKTELRCTLTAVSAKKKTTTTQNKGICTLYKIWQDVNISDESTFAAPGVLKVASCIFVRLLEAADMNVAFFFYLFIFYFK